MRKDQQPRSQRQTSDAPNLPDEIDLSPIADDDEGETPATLGRAAMDDERPTRAPKIKFGGAVRDAYPTDDDDPRQQRLARERRRRLAEMESNPFLRTAGQSPMPQLPDDDPQWSYKWIRWNLPAAVGSENRQNDVTNLQEHQSGLLRYEYVRMDDLPAKWKRSLSQYAVLEGKHEGHLVFKDLIAARCDRRMRDLKVEAAEIQANRLREQITHGAREKLERMAYDAGYDDMRVVHQDVERPMRGDGDEVASRLNRML